MAPKGFLKKDSDLFVRKFAIIYGNRPKNQVLGAISNGSQQDFLLGDTSNGPQCRHEKTREHASSACGIFFKLRKLFTNITVII